jgi:hypothetical protein
MTNKSADLNEAGINWASRELPNAEVVGKRGVARSMGRRQS